MRVAGVAVVVVILGALTGPVGASSAGPTRPPHAGPAGPLSFRTALQPATGPATTGPNPATASSPEQAFQLPVPPPPVVLSPFRPPEHRYGTGHRGVDLAAPAGTPIRAAAAGTVVYAGMLAGRGVVSVQHDGGLRTTYEPVDAAVHPGQRVTSGQALGTLQPGHPSCAPEDCLHWGARLPDETYLDPMSLLHPWRVVLKPWDPG